MTFRQIGFWTGFNAAMFFVNLMDAVLKGSVWHLALAVLAAAGWLFGCLPKDAA